MSSSRTRDLSPTVSAVAADAALRKAGIHCRLAGKIPGGDVRCLIEPENAAAAVATLSARWPSATVVDEDGDGYTVRITPAS